MIVRGEVYWVSFTGAIGAEIRKTRPAVVVSNNDHNAHMDTVTVVPFSSAVGKVRLYDVAIPAGIVGDGRACKAVPHHVKGLDKSRVGRKVGRIPGEVMRQISEALRVHLGL